MQSMFIHVVSVIDLLQGDMFPLFVTLKKVYDRTVVNKYRSYLLLGVIIFNLIDHTYINVYIYIYIYIYKRPT